ncbi:MAG TPA: metal ABC transporter substrate-binding protein [Candidatus Saccharimonadales bacterium]|nr:metal ABC transporter substrate-binding protein [Candidatus Saccharimonadales bacterium]
MSSSPAARRALLALACLLLPLSGCARRAGAPARVVVASIGPLADWARHVAGPGWQVLSVVPPGASPHAFEMLPRDVQRYQRAALWVRVGAGLDPFVDRLIEAAGARRVLTLTDGMTLVDGNPHVWLDPAVARAALPRIAAALAALEPADSAGFRARAEAYGAALDSVDAEYRAATARFRVRRFVAFHEAWIYLARRYGLEQAGSVEPAPGREPGPADWGRLVALVRASGSRVVFAEAQYGLRLPRALAADAGARVLLLDPAGTTGDPAGESYVALMRRNLAALKEGLQ